MTEVPRLKLGIDWRSTKLIAPTVALFWQSTPRFPEIAKIGQARNAGPLVDTPLQAKREKPSSRLSSL
jgi:hypothetical protein